ncbi:hypothetical protein HHL16_08275 [Pseudoflavitalea sp. G-6-1-2]|uniref:acyl-CoA thioester hydrolase/BAAT C-terminal domain-containing protein n=1 Tax=Pseudoflavitalea sp. G-6-1-2 TaxID=2728841 RepID=UPI00146E87E7|nr:acyl-CoA thioester hydrolase/BAAT C-terminal domain-containing protein [Pseudoflavitalea sp. G-6-1-2]NML20867.1 hypothetical protein [Pseudoflavitalea sp. G-6-1-2]
MKQLVMFLLLCAVTGSADAQDTLRLKNIDAILYTGSGKLQPLVVGLGGAEGGNAWASNHWKKTRDEFLDKGYAFLAIGYFGTPNSPAILDRIAIDDVYNAIKVAGKNKKVDGRYIAVIGGSRGADLALLLASYYSDIDCVIGMSSSHVVFPGHTNHFSSSCWTFNGMELPYVPVNETSVPFLMKRDHRGAFTAMLQDSVAARNAAIKVENIKGAVLLLSGKSDEMIPASEMAEKMVARFKEKGFRHHFEHIAYEGGHGEPTKHFDAVFEFLGKYFVKSRRGREE